jgi:PAS domain S-box-containing protein
MRCTLDSDGKILEANAVWTETLGYSEKKSIGAKFADFIFDDDFSKEWPSFPAFSDDDESKQEATITFETTKNDKLIFELTATRLLEPRKQETHYLISMVDVTEKKRTFERIERQKRELEKANEGLSTFAYVASHDLQEPLRKIRQYVEMLQQDCEDVLNKDGKYYLDVITGSAARISYLVKDILAYTTATNADVKITNLHLNDIVQDVIEEASEMIEKKNAKISVGQLPTARADWGAVKLLFQNLVSNALKYQAKGAEPKLTIKSRELKTSYVIDVTDNGIGIADIKDKDVFEPFVRLHSKFEYSGTGIGLAICRAVCERMNWELSHKSNPKGGTTFAIVIQK